MGDCKSPQGWSNLFRRRISNPPERLTDFKFTGTPNGVYPYALKGQKLLAQGTALGILTVSKTPCKGKSFVYCQVFESFCPYRATGLRP